MLATSFLVPVSAHAQDATWGAAPPTNNWNSAANWSPATVPTGTASFGASNTTALTFSAAATNIGTIQFNAGAPAYNFFLGNQALNITGVGGGIVNNSANAPVFTLGSGGTINFNNSAGAGNAQISNINLLFAQVNFNNNSNAGTATITNNGGGLVVTFSNSSSGGNSTMVITGELGNPPIQTQFLDSSTAGNAHITTSGNTAAGGVFFGAIGGTDTSNAGTATIVNNNNGGTNFLAQSSGLNANITNNAGGFTNVQDQSTLGNATIVNNNGGFVSFGVPLFGTDTATAGNAQITNTAGGTVEFFALTTAGNSTIANAGLTTFNDSSTAGSATITNNSGGTIRFLDSSTGGNARFINNAGGIFDISGLTAIAMTAGSIEGAGSYVLGSKALTVGGNNLSTEVAGVISGIGGALIKSGAGTLTLSGANTYSGGTTINAGVLQLGNGGTTGSIVGNVVDNGTFAINRSNAFTFDGVISGTGAFQHNGTGATTLSGTSTFTGATTVNAGALIVNGSIASSSGLTVNASGTVGGAGLLPKTTINGGNLSPGNPISNPISTIAIIGSLSFVGAGNYIVEVSPTIFDRTSVLGPSGSASLGGTLTAVGTGGAYTVGKRYAVLTAAGGVSGTFGNLAISGNFGATRPHIEYDANNVYLVLDPFALPLTGLTPNQRAVATVANGAMLAGSQPAPFVALFGLADAQLPAALDALSGEAHVSTASVLADESLYLRSAVLGRLRQASYNGDAQMAALSAGGPRAFAGTDELSGALAYAKSPIVTKAPLRAPQPQSDVVFWAQGFGAWGRFDTDANAATVRRDLAGFISGVDTRVSGNGRLGVAAGYSSSRNTLDARGAANIDTGHVAGYGGWSFGAFNLRAGGAYAFHTIDTDRLIAFPGFFDRATAHYDGHTGQVFGELGYGFALGNVAIEPFAGAAWVSVKTDAAAERGGLAALNFAGTTFETGYATLGIRAAGMVPVAPDMVLIPRGSLVWQHAFNSVTPAAVLAFQAAPAPFVIAGVPIARDSALAEAGLDLAIGRNATIGVSYVGQFARTVHDHAAKGKFSWTF